MALTRIVWEYVDKKIDIFDFTGNKKRQTVSTHKTKPVPETLHEVRFMYACDLKQFGKDDSMPFVNVSTYKYQGDKDRKASLKHTVFIDSNMMDRLRKYTLIGDDGYVVDAEIIELEHKNLRRRKDGSFYCYMTKYNTIDLSVDAELNDRISQPTVPFNKYAHDKFVLESRKEYDRYKKAYRIACEETEKSEDKSYE